MKKILEKILALTLVTAMLTTSVSALTPEQTLELLETYYLDNIPSTAYEKETVEEVLATLGDPYTVYMPASAYEEFMQMVNGEKLVGIGVMVQQVQDRGLEIVQVFPDSPASEAGLVAGDSVVAVDGKNVQTAEQLQQLVAGKEGTSVLITVQRANGATMTRSYIRREVVIPIVSHELMEGVPYIACSSFGDTTVDLVKEAMEEFGELNTPVIMDLQGNTGGVDSVAAGTAGAFVGGKLISYYLYNNGALTQMSTNVGTRDYTDQPVIVLTDFYSASGSEMFTATIRDYDAGISVGGRTYGKGIGQYLFDEQHDEEMFDGDSLKITSLRFYSPNGSTNHIVGIIPTLTVSPQNAQAVAILLSEVVPENPEGYLKVDLGGYSFYVNIEKAMKEDKRPAFQELLESVTYGQAVSSWSGKMWIPMGGAAIARDLGIPYVGRNTTDSNLSVYMNQLDFLTSHGILPWQNGEEMGIGETVTRGEFAHILAYSLQFHLAEGNPFVDVPADHPYAEAIRALYAKGIVEGYGNDNFRPDAPITGQEAVTMLANVAQWVSLEARNTLYYGFDAAVSLKCTSYDPWAKESAGMLATVDALLTDVAPTDTVRRDEAAMMIYKLLEGCNLLWTD